MRVSLLPAVVALLVACIAAPALAAPATKPADLTPKDIARLHAEAVAFMRANQYARAKQPLELCYEAVPAEQRPRALVLNHALLDCVQKVAAMRAVKDLTAFLDANEPDEQAMNLLGACLEHVGKNERVAEGDLYLAAARSLEAANAKLTKRGWPATAGSGSRRPSTRPWTSRRGRPRRRWPRRGGGRTT